MNNPEAEMNHDKSTTNGVPGGGATRWLCCPTCHADLQVRDGGLCCRDCDRCWPTRDGIADFTNSARRAEQETFQDYAKALPELVRLAKQDGWLEALSSVVRPLPKIGPGLFTYATDESKGNLVQVMNIERGQKVLDLGCGLGGLSVALVQQGADCHVIDVSHEQAAFTAQRCRQVGHHDVKAACAGDDMRLPVADDYFDGVVMNGVIEWLGCSGGYDGSPRGAQLVMLREAHRVLKPGGFLYVSSKNLYTLVHFLGTSPDHVTKIPWVGLLPSWLQRVVTLGRAKDSRTRIYGLSGYQRLFKSAGFREHTAYALLPSFRYPRRIVPLTNAGLAGLKRDMVPEDYNRRLERILAGVLPAFVMKRLVYCYGFVLTK